MLSFEDALEKLLSKVPAPRTVRVPLAEATGRVLARPVRADLDLPPFDKSFVDGYALRAADIARTPVRLQVVGTVAAGSSDRPVVSSGQAVHIMTGAPLPPGADAVQMVEKTQLAESDVVEVLDPVQAGGNIGPRGSEVKRQAVVLEPGRLLRAAEAGVLAAFGNSQVDVYAAPSAVVIATGDELVDVTVIPGAGQIRNSNTPMLKGQCAALGLDATVLPAVPDDPERTRQAVEGALGFDLALFSGGVSMGEYDYVHQVLDQQGVEVIFHKVAIKPGKPLWVGRKERCLVFGLPGNPVSAFVTFELFVRPAVRSWMGLEPISPPRVQAKLVRQVRQRPGRKFFKPARVGWADGKFRVAPIDTRGSADLVGFSRANSLLVMDASATIIAAGESVEVVLLDGGFLEDWKNGESYETHTHR